MRRYIFVTGGVVSSIGKGLAMAALGSLLQARGYKIRLRKLDPYLNVDPGTMSPYQHGEVFVTDDGAETDLDLGHYERFTGVAATKFDNVTTGRIYAEVLKRERQGAYLGATVQIIPHVTDAIKEFLRSDLHDEDFVLCEIGGTVGDMESLPFLEAIRQFGNEIGSERAIYIHVTWLPFIAAAGELKTKPTQHSVKELLSVGIQPDLLLCRSDHEISHQERQKIALFCNIPQARVISGQDVDSIYRVPITYHQQGFDEQVLRYFGISDAPICDLTRWHQITEAISHPKGEVVIGIVGKYTSLLDSYKSLSEALIHGGIAHNLRVHLRWIDSEAFERSEFPAEIAGIHGILVPGGFGERGSKGKIRAIQTAREQKIPYFGICLGMQLAVIETARHIAGLTASGSSEFGACDPAIIGLLTEWMRGKEQEIRNEDGDLGGTMRLGAYPAHLQEGSLAARIYGKTEIQERHRHRYEVNNGYREDLEKAGLVFSGMSPDGVLPEIVERPDHPWFLAVQFHPELTSKPFAPHPIFTSFIGACLDYARQHYYESRQEEGKNV